MNIWKIATRWSDAGDSNSSIIDIFRKYSVVFAGRSQDYIKGSVKPDDIIAMSDGITVVSVGKVIDSPKPLTEFQFDKSDINSCRFDYDNWVIGFKVKLFDLNNKDYFNYRQGTFHGVNEPYKTKIKSLFEKYNEDYSVKSKFSINAKTCTLKCNAQQDDDIILDDVTKYVIPIYQRPYSWSEEQIRKFISDIFKSYYGYDKETPSEPMFIGTMQLTAKKHITKKSGRNINSLSESEINNHLECFDIEIPMSYLFPKDKFEQDIIDGQQRLTTFLVLIKLLKIQHPKNTQLKKINLNWLETRVNNEEQNNYLTEFIKSDLENISEQTQNPYIKNGLIIKDLLNEEFTNDKDEKINFDINNFIKYILSDIHFVVIETFAGLSKTLQIFDAINTTGLDLNGGDIFKIRMYEYLTDIIKRDGKEVFNDISKLYAKIDNENKNKKLNISTSKININMLDILEIYKYILIAKYDLPNVLHTFGTHTFFERLFDTIFNINQWNHFNNAKDIKLSLNEIDQIIDIRYKWEEIDYPTLEDACFLDLIWLSRYGKYWVLIFLFIYRFKDDENWKEDEKWKENLFLFTRQLGKLFILYSVFFERAINNIHSFVYELLKNMFSENKNIGFDEVIEAIKDKMVSTVPYYDEKGGKEVIEGVLNKNIFYNAKKKNILCRLSAMIEESYNNPNNINEIKKYLFYSDIDIEHIQSYNDQNTEERKNIKQDWRDELNSIGNLMVLERATNRSIKNEAYEKKIKEYKKSKFKVVTKHAEKYKGWDLKDCEKRKKTETCKLVTYLYKEVSKLNIKDLFKLHVDLSKKVSLLCKTPIAKSKEETDVWFNDYEAYLKIKSQNVEPLPSELWNTACDVLAESQKMYYSFVENWFECNYNQFEVFKGYTMKENNEMSPDEAEKYFEEIENRDYTSYDIKSKINKFFETFNTVLEAAIHNKPYWLELHGFSCINSEGLIWNLSTVELFSWQLPAADPEYAESYREIGRIMAIYWFSEMFYRQYGIDNNKFEPLDLNQFGNIIANYNIAKN